MNISESFQLVIDDKLNFSRFGGCPGEDPGILGSWDLGSWDPGILSTKFPEIPKNKMNLQTHKSPP